MSVFFRVFGRWVGNPKIRVRSSLQDHGATRTRPTTSGARGRISEGGTSILVTEVQWTVPRLLYAGIRRSPMDYARKQALRRETPECAGRSAKISSWREKSVIGIPAVRMPQGMSFWQPENPFNLVTLSLLRDGLVGRILRDV